MKRLFGRGARRLGAGVLRQSALLPVLARFLAGKVRRFGTEPPASGKAVRLLALNASRYGGELRILDSHPDIEVLVLDEGWQDKVNALFLSGMPLASMDERLEFQKAEAGSRVARVRTAHRAWLKRFLPAFARLAGIDAICTCTFWYLRDRDWEVAARDVGLPFIVLHKENMKDEVIVEAMTRRYADRHYRFQGAKLCVYNANEQRCIVDGGVAPIDATEIVGSMRLDPLFRRRRENAFPAPEKAVTLFSFRHLIGGLLVPNHKGGFVLDGSGGFVDYFAHTHAAFAQLALRHPDWTFYIKPKWMQNWAEWIERAIVEGTGQPMSAIPNLIVTEDLGAQTLIERSKVVVGVNSTAVIEARITGRDVVVPFFDEAVGEHRDKIYFQRHFDRDLLAARSPEELIALVERCMAAPANLTPGDSVALMEEFFGFTDGNAIGRTVDMIKRLVHAEAQP